MFYSRFLESVERWPDAVAVEIQRQAGNPSDERSRYTYRQLRERAESVAAWLRAAGLEIGSSTPATERTFAGDPGSRCAILAANSPDWVAIYLGIVACGQTAVPLDTAFNAQQVGKLLADCGASLIFTDAKHLPIARQASDGKAVRLVLMDDPAAGSKEPSDAASLPTLGEILRATSAAGFKPAPVAADDVACILYTSGTTADPKGVMLSHANLRGEMDSVFRYVRFDNTDAILGVLPLFHALAQMANLMLPLACGARVVFLESLNTTELLRALSERNITLFCCVPQFFYLIHERIFTEARQRGPLVWKLFRAMLALSRAGRRVGLNLGKICFAKVHRLLGPKMRYLVTGGSRFDTAIGKDFHTMGFNVLQAYGLTECTGGAIATPPEDNVMGSIGKPLPGIEAKIVAPKPAPDGTGVPTGEIALRGPIIMKGYYRRPDATAEVIRDGWLHTGDLGYMDARGNFFITGRQKEVIVLSSGKNIYPEEIESYYLPSPWIKEICVMGLEGTPGSPMAERLHAVIVPDLDLLRQKKVVNMREVIRFDVESISSHLPAAKRILSYDIWQQELPRTTTRKLRRFEIESRVRQLHAAGSGEAPAHARELSEEDREWAARPEVERALALIRERVKGRVDHVHPRDNLELDLALDSMERVELLVELEQQMGTSGGQSSAAEVYTVRELIDLVLRGEGENGANGTGWETLLTEEPTDPQVRALSGEHSVAAPWFLAGRLLNVAARDLFPLRVSGLEKLPQQGAFILCPNHQSYLDAPLLAAALSYRLFRNLFFVGSSDLFGNGLMRLGARFLRLIPVDPDANLVPAMRAGAYGLRHGRVLMLYPEGERSIDGTPKMFKKGAAILAHHLQVPMVPVALDGFFDAWPRGRNFQKFSPLRIQIGDAIYPDPQEAPEAAYNRLTVELRRSVVGMWEQLRGERLHLPVRQQATRGSALRP